MILHYGPHQIIESTGTSFFEDSQYNIEKVCVKNSEKISFKQNFNKEMKLILLVKFDIIEISDKIIVYIIPGVYWFISNKKLDKFLYNLYKGTFFSEGFDKNLLNNFYHFGLIDIDGKVNKRKIYSVDNLYKHNHLLYFSITNSCNLNCDFCVAHAEQGRVETDILKEKEIKSILDDINKYTILKNKKKYTIAITGGEPFLRKDTINILEYCKNKNFNVNIATNGTLLTDDIISRISHIKNLSISISIDGFNSQEHNNYRGNGVFEKTIANVKELVKYNVPVFINSFVHNGNLDTIEKRLELFYSLGVKGVNFMNSFKRGRDQDSNFVHVDEGILFSIFHDILKRNSKYYVLLKNESKFLNMLTKVKIGGKIIHTGTGINEPLFLNEKGILYVSPSLSTKKEYIVGDIKKENFVEILQDNKKLEKIKKYKLLGDCKNCVFRFLCGGENFGESISVNGNLNNPHFFCKSIKNSYVELFRILSENDVLCNDKILDINFK